MKAYLGGVSQSCSLPASYYNLQVFTENEGLYKNRLCYARYEKPLKNHSLEVAKKYVETYSSSNAAALYPEERVTKINLVTLLITQKIQ